MIKIDLFWDRNTLLTSFSYIRGNNVVPNEEKICVYTSFSAEAKQLDS